MLLPHSAVYAILSEPFGLARARLRVQSIPWGTEGTLPRNQKVLLIDCAQDSLTLHCFASELGRTSKEERENGG
jgi:hypothetical protein